MFDDQYHSLQKQKIHDLLQKNVLSGSEVAVYLDISSTNLPSLIVRKKLVPFYTFNLENDYNSEILNSFYFKLKTFFSILNYNSNLCSF